MSLCCSMQRFALLHIAALLLDELLSPLAKDRLLGRRRAGPSVHFRALQLHHFVAIPGRPD